MLLGGGIFPPLRSLRMTRASIAPRCRAIARYALKRLVSVARRWGLSNSETRTPLAMRSLTSKDPTLEATQSGWSWDAALTPKGCQSTGRGEAPAKGGTPHGSPERATEYRKGHITSVMLTKEASHTRYAVSDFEILPPLRSFRMTRETSDMPRTE